MSAIEVCSVCRGAGLAVASYAPIGPLTTSTTVAQTCHACWGTGRHVARFEPVETTTIHGSVGSVDMILRLSERVADLLEAIAMARSLVADATDAAAVLDRALGRSVVEPPPVDSLLLKRAAEAIE